MAAIAKRASSQNTSHAVMAQRTEAKDSLDDFPTPPWATRALIEHAIPRLLIDGSMSCLEPAAGRGHMSKVLEEYFAQVGSADVHDYGYGPVRDFLKEQYPERSFDWVIANPPFRLAEEFARTALKVARVGVAMLVRTVFIESIGRNERLFRPYPPLRLAQFTERVPMVKGRLDKKASTATGYGWVIWSVSGARFTELVWIPACRKKLERDGDYDTAPPPRSVSPFPSPVKTNAVKKIKLVKPQEDLFGA